MFKSNYFTQTFTLLWLCPILIICSIVGCIDAIEYEVPTGLTESIVVQGRIVNADQSFVEINISRLFDFSPASRQPVAVKQVMLYDDEGNEMELETRVPGRYNVVLDETTPIQVVPGRGYRISLITFDGRSFESSLDYLPTNTPPIALDVDITQTILPNKLGVFTQEDQVSLYITSEIDKEAYGGLYWEVRNVFAITDTPVSATEPVGQVTCYINKLVNVNDIYVLDPSDLRSEKIENYELSSSLIDWRFAEGLFYEVRQYSLSRDAYGYWDAVNTLSEREGNMFDGPVGEIPTNLRSTGEDDERIFGYFFGTTEEIIRIKFDQSLIPPVRRLCPPPPERICSLDPGEGCTCGLCCDCRIEPQSTTIKPDYWID